ncbi:MAG: VOC family protein [Parasphingorhabdus sp.]
MSRPAATGHVVWHDLLTTDVGKACDFYAKLLGWTYEVEHAAEFVWKPGAGDYPLILSNGAAHGGLIKIEPDQRSCWLTYVTVDDVDETTRRSRKLDGTIEREPFDIPGVGRSAVVRDPQGGLICPFVASHDYPPPQGVFIWDELLTTDDYSARAFYGGLFTWAARQTDAGDKSFYTSFVDTDRDPVTGALVMPAKLDLAAQWVPYIQVADINMAIEKAAYLGAKQLLGPVVTKGVGRRALLLDPTGALFGLIVPEG